MNTNLLVEAITNHPGLIVTLHHPTAAPSDEDVERMLAVLLSQDAAGNQVKQLVFTDGPALSTKQRQRVSAAAAQAKSPLVAVVSGSTMVRGVATALAWFGVSIRGFPPDALTHAISYLMLPEDASRSIRVLCAVAEKRMGWLPRAARPEEPKASSRTIALP